MNLSASRRRTMSSSWRCMARWTEPRRIRRSHRSSRRRIIVATNIAETSLTVSGVTAVIDTGLHKVARYDEERGVDSLTTERVTLDSADQRAGRAARLGPGIARRLWDARDRLRPHREAGDSSRRSVRAAVVDPRVGDAAADASFEWFDRPSDERLDVSDVAARPARRGRSTAGITDIGRLLQRIPLHPRLARVLLAGAWIVRGMRGMCLALRAGTVASGSGDRHLRPAADPRSLESDAAASAAGRREPSTDREDAARRSVPRSHRRDRIPARAAGRLSRSCREATARRPRRHRRHGHARDRSRCGDRTRERRARRRVADRPRCDIRPHVGNDAGARPPGVAN